MREMCPNTCSQVIPIDFNEPRREGSCDPLVVIRDLSAFSVFTKPQKSIVAFDLDSLHNQLLERLY